MYRNRVIEIRRYSTPFVLLSSYCLEPNSIAASDVAEEYIFGYNKQYTHHYCIAIILLRSILLIALDVRQAM